MKPAAARTTEAAAVGPEIPAEVGKLIAGLPADTVAKGTAIIAELLQKGPETFRALVVAVGETFGASSGVQATYAMHGMVNYACRPGADAERRMVATVLAEELAAKHGPDLRALICQQLQLCGGEPQVPALAACLADERLCEPATHALVSIGGERAVAALREALPQSEGKRRITLIAALGRVADKTSAAEIRKSLSASDVTLQDIAMYAASNIGDAESAPAVLKAAQGEASYRRNLATDACLRLARRLGAAGDTAGVKKLLTGLAELRKAPDEAHERLAILAAKADALGADAVDELLPALASKDAKIRTPAARIAVDAARALKPKNPAAAKKLLDAIAGATKEETVLEAAAMLAGTFGK